MDDAGVTTSSQWCAPICPHWAGDDWSEICCREGLLKVQSSWLEFSLLPKHAGISWMLEEEGGQHWVCSGGVSGEGQMEEE